MVYVSHHDSVSGACVFPAEWARATYYTAGLLEWHGRLKFLAGRMTALGSCTPCPGGSMKLLTPTICNALNAPLKLAVLGGLPNKRANLALAFIISDKTRFKLSGDTPS